MRNGIRPLDRLLGLGEVHERVVATGGVLGPSGRDVDDGQGAAELASGARTAVGDGVGLDVAGQAVQFVAGLPDRDGVAQQLARGPGRHGSPGPGGVPRLFEVPVHRGRAHPLQLQEREPVIVGELAMRAQHRQPRRQHRLQILRARQIHHQPHPHQQVARLL